MSINTFSIRFRMSGTSFRELPAELIVPESCPGDYVDGLFSYTALFNDPAIGELVWRITQANSNNGSGKMWRALHFDDLIRSMRVEPLNPTTHARSSDYRPFGMMQTYVDTWDYYMERAKNDLVDSRDLKVHLERYLYPSTKLLAKMEPLRRADD